MATLLGGSRWLEDDDVYEEAKHGHFSEDDTYSHKTKHGSRICELMRCELTTFTSFRGGSLIA